VLCSTRERLNSLQDEPGAMDGALSASFQQLQIMWRRLRDRFFFSIPQRDP
jgi:hypothetical protein